MINSFIKNLPGLVRQNAREASLLGVSALIVLGLTGFSIFLSHSTSQDREIAEELNRFNAKLIKFGQELRSVESRQRGYIITEKANLAQRFEQSSKKLMPMAIELQETTPKALNAAPRLSVIMPNLSEKLAEMVETVSLVRQKKESEAYERVGDGRGIQLTDIIEDELLAIQGEANALIRSNNEATGRLERLKLATEVAGVLLILTFSSLAAVFLFRSNKELRDAQETLARSNVDLEYIVNQRTAALKRANDEIQRFAYIVSHDLRSPLVNIMGFTSELEVFRKDMFDRLEAANALDATDTLSKDFDEALSFIKSSIARMDRLINAILRISREGNRPLNPERLDMMALVNTLTEALAHQIREKAVDIHIGQLPNMTSDRLAIEQVFSNLIENAIKFLHPDMPGQIAIEGKERASDIVYTISDNGRGIDPKDHTRIFELFRRSGLQNVPGEGVGLAFVNATVRRLGGTVDVTSEVGKGSTFTVTLPKAITVQRKMAA